MTTLPWRTRLNGFSMLAALLILITPCFSETPVEEAEMSKRVMSVALTAVAKELDIDSDQMISAADVKRYLSNHSSHSEESLQHALDVDTVFKVPVKLDAIIQQAASEAEKIT